MGEAITIEDLEVRYGSTVALTDVTLTVPVGTTLAVVGPNGSGKSTLLRTLAGLEEPTGGTVHVADDAPALVLQSTDVDRSVPIDVRTTVAMARYPRRGLLGRFGDDDRAAVDAAMQRLEVDELATRQLHDLSGGQRQRVLVAQGLAQGAAVLLLDEPVNGLDLASRSVILDVIDEEAAAGTTVVLTTHSLTDARRCDRVLLLAGRAIAHGAPDEVLTEELLDEAFAGRLARLDGLVVVDDTHDHAH